MPDLGPPPDQPSASEPAPGPYEVNRTTDLSDVDPAVSHASAPSPPSPASADRYRLLAEIARGGMGVVWRAVDASLDREVAVKVLQGRYGPGSSAACWFADEARITARLQHPAIPPVHDHGVLPDGRPFLAMKLIQGRTLDELLHLRPDPAADRGRFVAMFEQVCQAVGYAHAHRVIHRDLKPANVMVGRFGEVQVMDWGLAKVVSGAVAPAAPDTAPGDTVVGEAAPGTGDDGFEVSLTQAGSVLGTLAYMAPEQAAGEVGAVGPRSDVFGLGAILAVILTGRPPYAGEDVRAVRVMALRGDLATCRARLDGCGAGPELVALCKRCLAFDPTDRPAGAGVVAEDVAGLRAAAEERARAAETERAAAEARAAEQKRRRRTQRALGLAVGALVVGAGAVAWWADRQAGERRADALQREVEDSRRAQEDALRAAADQSRLARTAQAVESLLGRCEDALRADDADQAGLHLDLAARRLAEGGAEGLRPRFDRLAAHLAVLRDLDRLNEMRWTPTAGRLPADADLTTDVAAAFRRYGLVPGRTPPDAAARLVAASPVRDRLLTAVDLWLGWSASGDGAVADGLSATLRAVDPDPYRGTVRDATRTDQQPVLRQLGGRRRPWRNRPGSPSSSASGRRSRPPGGSRSSAPPTSAARTT